MARYQRNKKSNQFRKRKIIIIADGETEINYIKSFIKCKTELEHLYDVEYKPNLTMTKTLLNYIQKIETKYDYIFALSDKDNLNNENAVYNSFCSANKTFENLICGYSNPCFEIWLYLHDDYRETEVSNTELVKKFEKKLGNQPFIKKEPLRVALWK